jgi:hypothetical protein
VFLHCEDELRALGTLTLGVSDGSPYLDEPLVVDDYFPLP